MNVLGPHIPDTHGTVDCLGLVYVKRAPFDNAEKLFRRIWGDAQMACGLYYSFSLMYTRGNTENGAAINRP